MKKNSVLSTFIASILLLLFSIVISYVITCLIFTGSPFTFIKEETKHSIFTEKEKRECNPPSIKKTFFVRNDIPFDGNLQYDLNKACREFGVDFNLALAVIWKETGYRNVYGDGGNSVGYMQIQPRWTYDIMEELNVTSLEDPYSNFRVGCKILSDYISQYGVESALTKYNSGSTGKSLYSMEVMKKWTDLNG